MKCTTLKSIALSAAAASLLLANASGQTTLLHEDWEAPAFGNNTWRASNDFAGWEIPLARNQILSNLDTQNGVPEDSTVAAPNQVIQLNGSSAYTEKDIAHVDMIMSMLDDLYNPTFSLFFSPNY